MVVGLRSLFPYAVSSEAALQSLYIIPYVSEPAAGRRALACLESLFCFQLEKVLYFF